ARQVEQHRRGNDRDDLVGLLPDSEPLMLFGEPAQDTVGSGESVGATTGKTDRIDTAYQVLRLQQIGLAGPRSTTALVHGTSSGVRETDNRGPGAPCRVDTLHVSDAYPGHVGDRVVG